MTGYAGSRDYLADGPRSLRRRPHTYLFITLKNRLRPLLQEFLLEGSESIYQWDI